MDRISDIVAAVVILFCAVRGFQRGFYGALLSVAGLVGGYVAVYLFSRPFGALIAARGIVPEMFSGMAASLLIFAGVSIAVSLLSALISAYLVPKDSKSLIARFYRLGGAGVGLASGVFFASLFVLLSLFLRASHAAWKSQEFKPSLSERTVARGATLLLELSVTDPEKAENVAVSAFYTVVSDPENGMEKLKEKATR